MKEQMHGMIQLTKYAGKWCIGGPMGICISMTKRPNLVHRFFMKLLLGIEWKDIDA